MMIQKSFLLLVLGALAMAQLPGTWYSRSPMIYKRSDHTANILNGTLIVLFGGCSTDEICDASLSCSCQNVLAALTAYDPIADVWTELAQAPLPRTRHVSAVVDNKLYVIGGRNINDVIVQEVHVYDISSNTWSSAPTWVQATSDGTAFTNNNTIYVTGGYDQNYDTMASTYIYSPLVPNANWTGNVVANMRESRGDACAAVINGTAYVLGGFNDASFCLALYEVEQYNFTSNTWTVVTQMNVNGGDKACASFKGLLQVFGGQEQTIYSYNATSGVYNCSVISDIVTNTEAYDPVTNSWTNETSIPTARFRFATADFFNPVTQSHQLFLFGGTGNYNGTGYNASAGYYGVQPTYNLVQVFDSPLVQATTGLQTTGYQTATAAQTTAVATTAGSVVATTASTTHTNTGMTMGSSIVAIATAAVAAVLLA